MEEVTTSTYELVRKPDGSYKINGDGGGASIHLTTAPEVSRSAQRPTAVAAASLKRLTRSLSFDAESISERRSTTPTAPRSARAIDTSFLKRFEEFHDSTPLSPVTPRFSCTSASSKSLGSVPEFQFFATGPEDDVQVDFLETPDLPDRRLGEPADGTATPAPPPSPSTPLSPAVPSLDGKCHSSPRSLGGPASVGAHGDGTFGDEATATIDELNTPSPLAARENAVTSKSCNCVMGLAMRDEYRDSDLPKEKLAAAMATPSSSNDNLMTSNDNLVTPAPKTSPGMPRSHTWPNLQTNVSEPAGADEVIKRFTVTHKLGKAPSLLCCVSIPEPPSVRSTDTASRWWWLMLITAFLVSSTSGFLSTGPRLFTRSGLSSTTSTVIHSPHNIPADHHDDHAQFAHFANFRSDADPNAVAEVPARSSAPVAHVAETAIRSWHMGMLVDEAVAEAERAASPQHHETASEGKLRAAVSRTIAHSVLTSGGLAAAPRRSLSALAEKGRRDRIVAKWALREVSRKTKGQLPEEWECNEYGCTLRDETADGVTGELVYSALSIAPLSEEQKLVARSIFSNVVFNTTTEFIGGGLRPSKLSDMFKQWVSDPSNVPRAILRHAVIPAATHMIVHGICNVAGDIAVNAATLPDAITDSVNAADVALALQHCADSVTCLALLQNTLLP